MQLRSRRVSESLSETSNERVNPADNDNDDSSENSLIEAQHENNGDAYKSSHMDSVNTVLKSEKSSKYNFCCEIDPGLDASERIALLEQRLQECRKMYRSVQRKLASIDRRKKKFSKEEEEEEGNEKD